MGRRRGPVAFAFAVSVGVSACFVSPALGAGKIYWADSGSGAIRVGNLNGTRARSLAGSTTQKSPPYAVGKKRRP